MNKIYNLYCKTITLVLLSFIFQIDYCAAGLLTQSGSALGKGKTSGQTCDTTTSTTGYPVLKRSDEPFGDPEGHIFYQVNGLRGIKAKTGDDAKSLSKAGHLITPQFLHYNDMSSDMPIVPENVYYLTLKNKKAAVAFHTVRAGDSLQHISQQYGIRMTALSKFNRTIVKSTILQPGQVIWLNKRRPNEKPAPDIPPADTIPLITERPLAQHQTSNIIPISALERKRYTSGLAPDSRPVEPGKTPGAVLSPVVGPAATTNPPAATKESIATRAKDNKAPDQPDTKVVPETHASAAPKTDSLIAVVPEKNTTVTFVHPSPAPVKAVSVSKLHIFEDGQTFYSISRLHQLTVQELLALNHFNRLVPLTIGQKLIIRKQAGEAVSGPSQQVNAPDKGLTARAHTVTAGETVFRISQQYQVSVEEIQRLNNLSGNRIKTGQKIKLP
jgi:membrane-bound lytic murein transglycosylase D